MNNKKFELQTEGNFQLIHSKFRGVNKWSVRTISSGKEFLTTYSYDEAKRKYDELTKSS